MLKLTLDRTEGTFEVTSEDRVYIRDEEVKISVAGFKFIELNGDTSLAPCFQVICGQKVLAEAMLVYDESASDTADDYGYAASGVLNTNTEQLARHFGGCADQTCQSLVCRVFSTAKMKPIAMGYVSLWNFPNGGTEPSNLTTGADLQKRIDAALTAATNAEASATKAVESASAAASSASDAAASASTAKAAMESAQTAQNVAETKANVATEQAGNALTYANAANASEAKAKTYAANAEASADAAAESAKEAASILPASVQDALGKFLSGQTFKTNTTNAMRNAMKTLLKALGATVSIFALTFCGVCVAADTPTVTKASLGDLDLNQNPTVVTDVSFSGLATETYVADAVKNAKVSTDGLVTSNELAAALASAAPADYANVSNKAVGAVQPADLAGYATTDALAAAVADAGKVKSVNGATGDVEVTAAGIGAASASEVASVWAYMKGETFRVVVTNYNSAVNPPRTRYDYRMSTSNDWETVWTETNGLAWAVNEATNLATTAATAMLDDPANRAWGGWDSHTGLPAPDGVVQVSGGGGLLIGSESGWTQFNATGGSYWVLTSTDPTLRANGTNGVFAITDPDGKSVMTIRKGDKRLVYADASSITTSGDSITVKYEVISDTAPTAECALALKGTWYEQGASGAPFAFTWTGKSGAWVMTATAPSGGTFPATGFFRAKFETGGDTEVVYDATVGLTKVSIGGKQYTVGTATVTDASGNAKTVLTLE